MLLESPGLVVINDRGRAPGRRARPVVSLRRVHLNMTCLQLIEFSKNGDL